MTAMKSTPPVVIFLHVHKTAGMSFRQWLIEYFSGNVLFHPDSRRARESGKPETINLEETKPIMNRGYQNQGATVSDLKKLFRRGGASAFDGYQAVGGHIGFDFPFIAAIERPVLLCAAVRDPVERAMSLYNWARLNKGSRMHGCVKDRTLFESLQSRGRLFKEIDNKQLSCIFGKKQRFSLNRKRPNDRWTIVCRHDRYDLMLDRLADIFGRPAGNLPFRNRVRSPYKQEIRAQPDFHKAVALIRELNAEETAFVERVGDYIELNRPAPAPNGPDRARYSALNH